MMTRCVWSISPDRDDYRLYRAKGIKVCERWLVFRNFLDDMGHKPTPRHTLDRIDCDGNYEPRNCRWATPKEQARNWKHRNRRIEFNGENLLLVEWAERIGIARESLRDRLNSGWSIEKALTKPATLARERNPRGRYKAIGA
jgi:hypothetical protein